MSAVVLSIPGDQYTWAPLVKLNDCCRQTAQIHQDGKLVCLVTVHWPTPLPQAPVVCHTDGRHGGERD
jgi:hypothetical protein